MGEKAIRRVDSKLRNKNYNVRFPVFVMRTAFGAIPTRRNVAIRVTTNLSRANLFRSFELKFCLDSPLGENIGRGATIVTILSRTLENAPTTPSPNQADAFEWRFPQGAELASQPNSRVRNSFNDRLLRPPATSRLPADICPPSIVHPIQFYTFEKGRNKIVGRNSKVIREE